MASKGVAICDRCKEEFPVDRSPGTEVKEYDVLRLRVPVIRSDGGMIWEDRDLCRKKCAQSWLDTVRAFWGLNKPPAKGRKASK